MVDRFATMPPVKKRSSAGGSKAANVSTTMANVNPLQHALSDMISKVFSKRHNAEGTHGDGSMLPWPFLHDGTFHDICARAWQNQATLFERVAQVMVKTGLLLDGSTVEDMACKYMAMKDLCE